MSMMHKKNVYDQLIRDAINFRMVHDMAFGYIRFEWAYAFPYVTIVDRITQLYLEACEASENRYNRRDPFNMVRGEVRFEYGTPYIANIMDRYAQFYEFEYTTCMKCPEHGSYCGMDECEVKACMQRAEDKYWSDLAAPHWDD